MLRRLMVHKYLCFTFHIVAGSSALPGATLASRCSHVTGTHQENVKGSDMHIFSGLESVHVSSILSLLICLGAVNSETLGNGRAQDGRSEGP